MNENTNNDNGRILYLSENVTNSSIKSVAEKILEYIHFDNNNDNKLKNFKREPIHLYIQSFGGSIYDMYALIDIILTSKTPIYTYCFYAMSAGSMIFMAGHERFVYENSTIMIHQMSCSTWGKYLDLKIDQKENDRIQKRMNKFILSRTKIGKKKYYEHFNNKEDWYIDAKKALKLGIATKIIK